MSFSLGRTSDETDSFLAFDSSATRPIGLPQSGFLLPDPIWDRVQSWQSSGQRCSWPIDAERSVQVGPSHEWMRSSTPLLTSTNIGPLPMPASVTAPSRSTMLLPCCEVCFQPNQRIESCRKSKFSVSLLRTFNIWTMCAPPCECCILLAPFDFLSTVLMAILIMTFAPKFGDRLINCLRLPAQWNRARGSALFVSLPPN